MTARAGTNSNRATPDARSRLYWLDIYVSFNDIMRQTRMMSGRDLAHARVSFEYSTLHGEGRVSNALSVGDRATTFHSFDVDVAALAEPDGQTGLPEAHRSARMIWNEIDVRSPRLQIYVQNKMLRHLVELYVTKRIDTVVMSMKIAVERDAMIRSDAGSDMLPILDRDGRLYFRRTQCELLSVQASLVQDQIARR